MHRAERQANGGDTSQHARGDWDERQNQHAQRAEKPQQQRGDHHHCDDRQSLRVATNCVAGLDGENAGPGDQQAELLRAALFDDRRETLTYIPKYDFLRIDVEARRFGLRDQQRAFAVARKPHAVALRRPALAFKLFDEVNEFPGRIFRQHALHQHAQRRIQHVEIVVHRLA